MASTQDHLDVEQIRDDIVVLKDGSMALVMETSAVNFGLLSENEQLAIISAFASLLNSLSFSIQIVIRSKRLDISSYLQLLADAQKKQTNPLLVKLMLKYRDFISKTVRENQVLDKQFYIVIPLSYLEVGMTKNVAGHFEKALTILLPRRDHIIRQLYRTGLKSNQLTTKQLISLFSDIYNPLFKPLPAPVAVQAQTAPVSAQQPKIEVAPQTTQPQTPPPQQPSAPVANPQTSRPTPQTPLPQQQTRPEPKTTTLVSPFVVEELGDEYGTA